MDNCSNHVLKRVGQSRLTILMEEGLIPSTTTKLSTLDEVQTGDEIKLECVV